MNQAQLEPAGLPVQVAAAPAAIELRHAARRGRISIEEVARVAVVHGPRRAEAGNLRRLD
jgi:hypothetical protein